MPAEPLEEKIRTFVSSVIHKEMSQKKMLMDLNRLDDFRNTLTFEVLKAINNYKKIFVANDFVGIYSKIESDEEFNKTVSTIMRILCEPSLDTFRNIEKEIEIEVADTLWRVVEMLAKDQFQDLLTDC